MLLSITEKIIKDPNDSIYYEDAYRLAVSQDNAVDLITCANKIREKYKKNNVFTCSIINAKSGRCSENCAFCAQSAHHKTGIETYPLLDKEKIINNSILMEKAGATKYSMVTSGHSLSDGEIDSIGHTA
ncbi:MAG: biotin synthase BioB, partial [Proteobacteria bacterium]|nr:biotin synthase BioB [Pseudomonadota bacterium]